MKKLILALVLAICVSPLNALISTRMVTLDETGEATDWLKLNMEDKVEFNIVVNSVSTNVVVRPESAFLDEVNDVYYPFSLIEAATVGTTPNDVTINATGNYRLHKDTGIASEYVRLKLVSFAGATPNIQVNITAKRN